MKLRNGTTLSIALIILAIASRFIPHPPNFSPLMGAALFAGARFNHRGVALGVPLFAMIVSDLFLGWHSTLPFVYFSLATIVLVGAIQLRPADFGWGRLATASSFSSLGFFVVTNFGVWVTQDIYSPDLVGFVDCFVAAIPFFPATLISGWIYSFALFALSSAIDNWAPEATSKTR